MYVPSLRAATPSIPSTIINLAAGKGGFASGRVLSHNSTAISSKQWCLNAIVESSNELSSMAEFVGGSFNLLVDKNVIKL